MIRVVPLLSALALVLAGCATDPGEPAVDPDPGAADPADIAETGSEPADPGEPATDDGAADALQETDDAGIDVTIVATVFPLAWMAGAIAPGATLEFLGTRGTDPHDLELSPAQRAVVETADVVLYMGPIDFQPQVEAAVAAASGVVVSVADVVGESSLLPFADDHDEGAYDPHVWFDARAMADVAEAIGAALASVAPDDATTFTTNAAAVHDELGDLAAELDAMLAGCTHDTAIVSHEAYAYLLAPRDLDQEGISGAGGHGDASPARIAELTATIRDAGIPAVLVEPAEGRASAEALAAEAGVDLIEIDPLEVVTDEELRLGFPELLRRQGEAFAVALDCSGA